MQWPTKRQQHVLCAFARTQCEELVELFGTDTQTKAGSPTRQLSQGLTVLSYIAKLFWEYKPLELMIKLPVVVTFDHLPLDLQ